MRAKALQANVHVSQSLRQVRSCSHLAQSSSLALATSLGLTISREVLILTTRG